MFYDIIQLPARFLLKFFIKRLEFTGLENLPKSGAVLLASNHSNSFFDAVILCAYFVRRVWSLARGDVFKKPLAKKALSSLYMMPMYRLSEGKEYLGDNDDTFNKCISLFKQGEMVLIFSEGLCTHQTKLLPLKKGTGRLAHKAWEDNIDVVIVPIAITYNNFNKFGKLVKVNIGKPMPKEEFPQDATEGMFLKEFNRILTDKLNALLDTTLPKPSFWKNPWYYIGLFINFPINALATGLSRKLTRGSVFFDSITAGFMIFVLPIYWILLALLVYFLTKSV